MANWQGGRQKSTGDLVDADNWNDAHYTNPVHDYNQFHSGAFVTRTTDQSVGLATAISFDNEEQDTDSYHDGVNPTRLTVPDTGVYLVSFYAEADAATAFILGLNGGSYLIFDGTHTEISRVVRLTLVAGWYLEVYANTAARTIYAGAAFSVQQEINGSLS